MKRIAAVLLVLVASVGSVTSAQAIDCVGVDGADADTPHVVDFTSDWVGNLSERPRSGTYPGGDVWREGTDITQGWIARGEDGRLRAYIQVVELLGIEQNAVFYFRWSYTGSTPAQSKRWVSVRLKAYGSSFSYGFITTSITGGTLYSTVGDTTGTVIPGRPGTLVMDFPTGEGTADWGQPAPGSTLDEPLALSFFSRGSPEQLPPNPTGLRYGFIDLADDTADGDFCETIDI